MNKLPSFANNKYRNPLSYNDASEHTNPDPYVISWCGNYYCYSTDKFGIQVSVSNDLVNWDYHRYAYTDKEHINFWAPAVIYHNGLFYMYFSSLEKDDPEGHNEYLKVAVSKNPIGPFEYKKTLFKKFSIDAHPVKWNNEFYLFYSTNDITGCREDYPGTIILVDKLVDFLSLEGNPKVAIKASLNQEIFAKNRFNDGRDWYTIEGACFWPHNDNCYLLYSANAYTNVNYFVGYSIAAAENSFIDLKWNKYPQERTFRPLLLKNEAVEGTGHNTIVKSPNLVDDWIVYHGRDASVPINEDLEQRVLRIDPIFYDGKKMLTTAPSYDDQDIPELPSISERNIILLDESKMYSVNQFYYAQFWIQTFLPHTGSLYGIIFEKQDDFTYVELLVSSGLNNVQIIMHNHGIEQILEESSLPRNYQHDVPHCLALEKMYSNLVLKIDDEFITKFSIPFTAGNLGITAHHSKILLNSIVVTQSLHLNKENLPLMNGQYQISPEVMFVDNALCPKNERAFTMKSDLINGSFNEEFSVSSMGEDSEIIITLHGEKELELGSLKGSMELKTIYLRVKESRICIIVNEVCRAYEKLKLDKSFISIQMRNMKLLDYVHTKTSQNY